MFVGLEEFDCFLVVGLCFEGEVEVEEVIFLVDYFVVEVVVCSFLCFVGVCYWIDEVDVEFVVSCVFVFVE